MGTSEPVRVGLIGLGAIGGSVVKRAAEHDDIELVGAVVRDASRPRPAGSPPVFETLDELLALKPDVVVEVAGHEGLRAHGLAVLRAGCDLYFVAVGALADPETERELLDAAAESGRHAKIISGAIGALDALAGASAGELRQVTHTTRKPAATLMPADEAAALTEAVELFSGSAREGALKFPESVNVAAAVSFAGLGLDRTTLRVLADPEIERNRHEVEAEGEFGTLRFEIMNVPSADNPKSGSLVAMSIIHQLRQRRGGLVVG
ncbi:MAG: aspartate dehydrogenase [Thermomicrobiales bacterium]